MRYRKLRIAWSVACGIVCLLLILLWVRSYWWDDAVYTGCSNLELDFISGSGWFIIQATYEPGWLSGFDTSRVTDPEPGPAFVMVGRVRPPDGNGYAVVSPYWCAALLPLMLSTVPWHRWRFRLRTLLIATTLVAVVLGLIVYATRVS